MSGSSRETLKDKLYEIAQYYIDKMGQGSRRANYEVFARQGDPDSFNL